MIHHFHMSTSKIFVLQSNIRETDFRHCGSFTGMAESYQ